MWQKLCTFSAIYHSWWYTWFNWKILIKRSFRRNVSMRSSTYVDVYSRTADYVFQMCWKIQDFLIFFSRISASKLNRHGYVILSKNLYNFSALHHRVDHRGFVIDLTARVPVFPDYFFMGQNKTFFQILPHFSFLGKGRFS